MKQQLSLKLGDKIKHCHIILMPEPHNRAWQFLYEQKVKALPPDHPNPHGTIRERMKGWLGPQFEDVAQVTVAEGCVSVRLHDYTTYTYPLTEVARIKTFITQENSDAA